MKRIILLFMITFIAVGLFSCGDDYIEVEATIIDMYIDQGSYYFSLEYEMDGYEEPLTAIEKVSEKIYESYQIGDTYIFRRPDPATFRRA